MDGYLSKPIDTEALWRELNAIAQGDAPVADTEGAVLEGLAVADFGKARQLMDNSQELFDEITRLFLEDAPPHMQHIKEGLTQGDSEAVRHSAHTIKGMVGIFSADRAHRAAENVEKMAGKAGCDVAVANLDAAVSELLLAVKEYQW
jgi:protein-histidine pros-kinase